jgi:hypothetical protein
MAIRPKAQIGTMPCVCCGEKIPVRRAENGTLNFTCSWCEFPGYAKAGTAAHGHVMRRVELLPVIEPETPAPAKPEPKEKPPAPATRRPNSIFGV